MHLRNFAGQLDIHAQSLRQHSTTRDLPPLSAGGIILSDYWKVVSYL